MKKIKGLNKFIATVMMGCILVGNVSNAATPIPASQITTKAQQELNEKCSMKPIERTYKYHNWHLDKDFKPTQSELELAEKYVEEIEALKKGEKVVIKGTYWKVFRLAGILEAKYSIDGVTITSDKAKAVYKYSDKVKYVSTKKIKARYITHLDNIILSLGITKKTSQYDAIVKIYKYISEFYTYDFDFANCVVNSGKSTRAQKVVDAHVCEEVLDTYSGVCSCFAKLLQDLLKRCGIPCGYVSDEPINHAYNVVKFGGRKYYLDVTWGLGYAQRPEELSKDFPWYFFENATEIKKAGKKPTNVTW